MSETVQRILLAAAVIVAVGFIAKVVDARISRRELAPEAITRYRVLRQTIVAVIVFVGVLSALLVIPHVRAIAGAVLASSAVIGLVIGFASQRTIGNAVAGVLIALSQPLRIGDEVEIEGTQGTVEEIGLTYTWIRTRDNDRLVVPNEKLASSSIRNSTIRNPETMAEIAVHVPVTADLRQVLAMLRADVDEAYVSDLDEQATIVIRKRVAGEQQCEAVASELRLQAAERLKAAGIIGP